MSDKSAAVGIQGNTVATPYIPVQDQPGTDKPIVPDVTILKQWFERDILYAKWGGNVEVLNHWAKGSVAGTDACYSIRVYTDTNRYTITARHYSDGHAYLGCVAQSRKPRAGEDWNRGNDMPDGPLSEDTWRSILAGIVGYELVKVHRSTPALADE